MKKKEVKSVKPVIQDPDPLDGGKAVGCLFIGVAILIILGGVGSYLISLIR